MNLVDPRTVGPSDVFDAVAARTPVDGAELVGLIPEAVLRRTRRDRWAELDLAEDRTVEARLADEGSAVRQPASRRRRALALRRAVSGAG